MHDTALCKVRFFLAAYHSQEPEVAEKTVLDVGSCTYAEQTNARALCEAAGLKYVGLDIVSGLNVDVVTKTPFVWDEISDESYDYVISTCTFEHNPFFWATFAEMARVVKSGGKVLVTAPGSGNVHRFPLDCWRFYPDSWGVLCKLTGLKVDEVINEPEESKGVIRGAQWWDSSVIATKPMFSSSQERVMFHNRLKPLVEPYREFGLDFTRARVNKGPAFRRYLRYVERVAEKQRVPQAHRIDKAPEAQTA